MSTVWTPTSSCNNFRVPILLLATVEWCWILLNVIFRRFAWTAIMEFLFWSSTCWLLFNVIHVIWPCLLAPQSQWGRYSSDGRGRQHQITKASYASWSSSCFSEEYARGWVRQFLDIIRLNPPLAACNSEVVGSTPPPSIESKTVGFILFFALQGCACCATRVKCTILRLSGYHYHLGCLDRLQIQHEEKSFIVGASSMMAVLASIWGAFFSSRLSYLSMPCPC